MYFNLLEKIKQTLENHIDTVDFQGVYIGNDAYSNFYSHYEFSNFIESFFLKLPSL